MVENICVVVTTFPNIFGEVNLTVNNYGNRLHWRPVPAPVQFDHEQVNYDTFVINSSTHSIRYRKIYNEKMYLWQKIRRQNLNCISSKMMNVNG